MAMFFEDEDVGFDLYQLVRHELRDHSSLDTVSYGLKTVPTHTEDGIPIRKLYVSNLPPKTTRTELFGVFAQYGFIKSCWMRMGEKGRYKSPIPTYAFVTYSNPADAHKALKAPSHEKILRGRHLRISPADSWHQPTDDSEGKNRLKQQNGEGEDGDSPSQNSEQPDSQNGGPESSTSTSEVKSTDSSECTSENQAANSSEEPEEEPSYTILEILNQDCLTHILSYVPINDLIRSERVSKGWQNMIHEHLDGVRTLKTSWWQPTSVLTTAVLRRVLGRLSALRTLHIDHQWSSLNDRTAHTVGKFCPQLEELKVVGMHTKNWNPLIYGCKLLKHLSFISCSKLTDKSLVHLVKAESCIESLTVANNSQVTGLFLTGCNPPMLNSLSFYNCYNLQGTVICAAIDTLPALTTLRLDVCTITMWKIIPLILKKLPQLEELSLSEYSSTELSPPQSNEEFCEALATLKELKILNLSKNVYINNAVMKVIAQTCQKLESLNVSCCNSWKAGVGDEGVTAVCIACPSLKRLDVSYLAAASDAAVSAAANLPRLRELTARGLPAISAAPLVKAVTNCSLLQELDASGSDNVSSEVVVAAVRALNTTTRPPLRLWLAGTAAANTDTELPTHKLLSVDTLTDRSDPQLRPDFEDHTYDDDDDSFEDLYIHDEFDNFLGPGVIYDDDEMFLDDEDFDEYGFGLALEMRNIILL